MVTDPLQRSAARTATLIALPLALLGGLTSFWALGGFSDPAAGSAAPGSGGPGVSAPAATRTAPTGPAPTTAVTVDSRTLAGSTLTVCRDVIARLPTAIHEVGRRPVSAGPEQNAAYGDPPITLACGTATPAIQPTADVWPLSGVCWYAEPGATGTVWTTVDRTVAIQVIVPGAKDGSAQSVIAFSAAIVAADPPLPKPPTGCLH